MKLPITMYLIIFVSASIVLYQYHLSSAMLSQNGQQNYNQNYVRNSGNTLNEDTFRISYGTNYSVLVIEVC